MPHLIIRPSWLPWHACKVPPLRGSRVLMIVARSDARFVTGIRLRRRGSTRHEFGVDWRPAAAARTAAAGGGSEGNCDEGGQTRAQQRAAGTKNTALFDIVKPIRTTAHARAADLSCPGRAPGSARCAARGS